MRNVSRLSVAHGIGMFSERTRKRMISRLRNQGISDERVLSAMYEVPRHLFVDQALSTRAYDDVALPIGLGQTISQPFMVARMTEALLQGGPLNRVLEIGTGCGYQTAILLKIAKEVYSIERLGDLLKIAKRNLREVGGQAARLVHQDGRLGLMEAAPFDGIIITAAARQVPEKLLEQLIKGGRIVAPIGEEEQYLWRLEKTTQDIHWTCLAMVRFVPLLAGRV